MATHRTLITRTGTAPYAKDAFDFQVTHGGALRIVRKGNQTFDLIAPGYWVAVVDGDSADRLDWDFLVGDEGS